MSYLRWRYPSLVPRPIRAMPANRATSQRLGAERARRVTSYSIIAKDDWGRERGWRYLLHFSSQHAISTLYGNQNSQVRKRKVHPSLTIHQCTLISAFCTLLTSKAVYTASHHHTKLITMFAIYKLFQQLFSSAEKKASTTVKAHWDALEIKHSLYFE